ncbi:MAG: hypothetical protein ACK42D_02755 [Candidatus Paceibacteria bacterium]
MQHEELAKLLKENQEMIRVNNRLVAENNQLLHKMRRNAIIAFWFRLLWIAILIGGPLLFYWYFLGPLLESLSFGGTGSVIELQLERFQELFDAYQQ